MYKDQKVNPVGGCCRCSSRSPMFFALFSVLQSNIELRNAPFVGWIDNLAGPDVLYRLPADVAGHRQSPQPVAAAHGWLDDLAVASARRPPRQRRSGPMAQQQFS